MAKKSSESPRRKELKQQLDWALRGLSTSTVLAATTIAQKVGLGPNDLRCAELLVRNGPMTAGQLAAATGLTSGAITGIVDRLEQAGWARRGADPADRRRVVIHAGPQDTQVMAGLYDDHLRAMDELLADYGDEQLALILDFVRQLTELNYAQAGRPRPGAAAPNA